MARWEAIGKAEYRVGRDGQPERIRNIIEWLRLNEQLVMLAKKGSVTFHFADDTVSTNITLCDVKS